MKLLFSTTCLKAAVRAGRTHDDTWRIVARSRCANAIRRGAGRARFRWTLCPACRPRHLATRPGDRDRHRGHAGALGRYLGLSSGWLGATARHRAPRRLARRRDARDDCSSDLRHRRIRVSRFCHALRGAGGARASGVLDAAARRMGFAEFSVRQRRSIHLVCRTGVVNLCGRPVVCLDGSGDTLRAALRYLLFALLGSMLYLLGTVMLYGAYGTLDIPLLATRVRAEPIAWPAAALMTTGLLAKTALFPLHLWLPPAHAGAPAAASAVLSALVVKGSFFLVIRIWFDVMSSVATLPAA